MTHITVKSLAAAVALSLLVAGQPALASGHGEVNAETRAQITQQLSSAGYDVRKIVKEDGQFEVYAIKDGSRFQLYLDDELNVVRTKQKN